MSKTIILNWSPPSLVSIPSPAHSILKSWLNSNGYDVSVLYWNLLFYSLQGEFVFQNQKARDEQYELLLYLNYIAFYHSDNSIYNDIKTILQSINPSFLTSDPSYYDRHMESAFRETERIIDGIFSSIDFSQVLFWGFSLKMDQWLFASILADKVKKKDPTIPIVVGGIDTKDNAISYLSKFPQFDYATWGEGETPLLELTRYLEQIDNEITINDISNLAYKRDNKVMVSNKRNHQYLDMTNTTLFPDFSDYFATKSRLGIICPSYITIEGSRGCHWNRCHFCYLNTDYRYRLKSIENIVLEINYMIDKYRIYDFEFLDNDLIGKDIKHFNELLDSFIEIKKENPQFQIVLAEIITKDLDYATIKKMFEAGIVYSQIGYESASSVLLRKIDKKNTFSSNLLYVKFAIYHKIPLGGVNVITGLLEETSEDLMEACSNLRFLRFYLDYKQFRHARIPLTVNSSSRYFKAIDKDDSSWRLVKTPHILLRHLFTREEQWKLFHFVQINDNIHWNSFLKIEAYYLSHKHSYRIDKGGDKVRYEEYLNNKIIQSFIWDIDSIEVEILYRTNDKPRNFQDLYLEFVYYSLDRNSPIYSEDEVKNALDRLYDAGLVYFDKIYDNANFESNYMNIVSVIVFPMQK